MVRQTIGFAQRANISSQITPVFNIGVRSGAGVQGANPLERQLTHLWVHPNNSLYQKLEAIRTDTRIRANKLFLLETRRTRDVDLKQGDAENENYWDDFAADAVFQDVETNMYLVFPKSALVVVGPELRLDHTCKYVFSVGRNAANTADLDLSVYQQEVFDRLDGAAAEDDDDNNMANAANGYAGGQWILFGNGSGRPSFEGYFESPRSILAKAYGAAPANLAAALAADRLHTKESNSRLMRSISDKFWTHIGTVAAAAPPNINVDDLYDAIYACWDMAPFLWGNDLSQITQVSPIVRSKFSTVITEPLFGFGGTSEFRPSSLLPNGFDYLPPLIQDYQMTIHQHSLVKTTSSDFAVVALEPQSGFSVQVRNIEAFDQATKDLQTCDIPFPLMLRFESVQSNVEFETQRGAPDKILVYLERSSTKAEPWSEYQPVIETISVKVIGQDIDTVSKLDTTHMWYSTKRNSNFRTDANWNRRFRGAILLDASDLENWTQWTALRSIDNFVGSITVTTSQSYDDGYRPTTEVAKLLNDTNHKLTVVFFYEDYAFSGQLNNCRFWKI